MKHARPTRGSRRGVFICLAVVGMAATGTVSAMSATAAAPAFSDLVTAVTCAVTTACVSGANTSTGPGVTGTSAKGYGVVGNGKTGIGVRASSVSNYGLLATSTSGPAAVVGTTPAAYGLWGYTSGASGGIGVYGSSVSGYGLYGTTTTGGGVAVVGFEPGPGIGVYGYSLSGNGVQASTSNGYGLHASASGAGTAAYVTANTGYGVIASSNGNVSVYGKNGNGNAGDFTGTYIGVVGRAPTSGYPLVLTDTASNNVFYVDGVGNVSYKGGLYNFSPTRTGATIKSFSPKTTLPTVEDTGTAQLVGGAAEVPLDATFAASMDPNVAYRVFVTPNGDTRGLFVATKSAAGFVVRESQAGRSSVSFDYRIVATAFGHARERMAVTLASTAPKAIAPNVPNAPNAPMKAPVRQAQTPSP